MNFFKTFLCACLLASGLTTLGQTPTIDWGPEFQMDSRVRSLNIVGFGHHGLFQLEFSPDGNIMGVPTIKSKHLIRSFDWDLEEIGMRELMVNGEKKHNFHSIRYLKGNLYLFTTRYVGDDNQDKLFVSRMDPVSLKVIGEPEVIVTRRARRHDVVGRFNTRISSDTSKMMVFYSYQREGGSIELKYGVKIFDKDLSSLWEKEDVTEGIPYGNSVLRDYFVDNSGNFYLAQKVYEEKRKKEQVGGKPNYYFHFRLFTEKGSQMADRKFDLGGLFIHTMKIELDENGHLACAGLFAEKYKLYSQGFFFFKLNTANAEIYSKTQERFDQRTLGQMKKIDKAGKDEIIQFDLQELVLRDDGSAILIAENYNSIYNHTTDEETHYYEDLLVLNISSQGELAWVKIIPKKQVAPDLPAMLSFAVVNFPDRIVLLFNDDVKNLDINAGEKANNFRAAPRNAIISMVSIDMDGNVKREILPGSREKMRLLYRQKCYQLDKSEMLIYRKFGRAYQYGILSLK